MNDDSALFMKKSFEDTSHFFKQNKRFRYKSLKKNYLITFRIPLREHSL